MSFLYPVFLIGGLAVAVPIVLHLLRRDVAPEVPFTAVRLLRRSPVERPRRRRLRDVLLLAARIAALLLLAAAFARPYAAGSAPASTRVVAIDRSFSMSAPGQFAAALERARRAIDSAGSTERVALIAFDDRADLVAAPGGRSDARAALDGLAPGVGGTRYAPVIERIAALGAGTGTLAIIGDLQRPVLDQEAVALPPGWRLEVHDVAAPPGNLAVTGVAVVDGRARVTIRNAWPERKHGTVRLRRDGEEIASSPFAIEPGTVSDVPVDVRLPAAGALAVSVDDPGGFAADDSRFLVLGTAARPGVLIAAAERASGQSGFYLARALETPEMEGGFAVTVAAGAAMSRTLVESLRGQALVVLLSTRGLDRRAREALAAWTRDGGGLWLAAGPDLESSVVATMFGWERGMTSGEIDQPNLTIAATDLRHPIFRPFGPLLANLGSVRIDRAWRVAPANWNVLARFTDGSPALLERPEGRGRVLLFASDLDRRWNDFPLHPSFVPFAIETARYAAGAASNIHEFTVGEVPPGVPDTPGVHTLPGRERPVAVNVDPLESGTDTLSRDELAALFQAADGSAEPAAGLQALEIEAAQSYWRYGIMLMLAALVLESAVGRADRHE